MERNSKPDIPDCLYGKAKVKTFFPCTTLRVPLEW